jgi:hypothetical protein
MGEQEGLAGCVISAVGSLSLAQLHLAGATQATAIHGELGILSLHEGLLPPVKNTAETAAEVACLPMSNGALWLHRHSEAPQMEDSPPEQQRGAR